jgi:hypothetical protein
VRPSLDFVPLIYSPLYFHVAAAFSKIGGIGFMPLRLVSLLASIGSLFVVFAYVARATGKRLPGLVSCAAFAGTYAASGYAFDLARVDSLFLLFVLGSIVVLRFGAGYRAGLIAGMLMALGFLTKQPALGIGLVLLVALGLVDRRGCLAFGATLIGTVLASTLVLDWIHDGWYSYYVLRLPMSHSVGLRLSTVFWWHDIVRILPVALVMVVVHAARGGASRLSRGRVIDTAAFVGAMASSWMARIHPGAANVLLPAYALFSIGLGLAFHRFTTETTERTRLPGLMSPLVHGLVCVQMALLFFDPRGGLPTADDVRFGDRLIGVAKEADGAVLLPGHGYLAAVAGKSGHAHAMPIYDVLRGGDRRVAEALSKELDDAIHDHRFGVVVAGDPLIPWPKLDRLEQSYRRAAPLNDGAKALSALHDGWFDHELIYMPR